MEGFVSGRRSRSGKYLDLVDIYGKLMTSQDPRDADQTKNTAECMTEDRSVNQIISQGQSETQRDQPVAHEWTGAVDDPGRCSSGSSTSW